MPEGLLRKVEEEKEEEEEEEEEVFALIFSYMFGKGKHAAEKQQCNQLLDGALKKATDNGGRSPDTTGCYERHRFTLL
jgi:hypothetical protein